MIGFYHTLFDYPNGIVVGNLLASLIWVVVAGPVAYFSRHHWMKRFVAFHHHHKKLHEDRIANG